MKFTNGNWLLQEGVTGSFPAEVYRYTIKEDRLSLLAPTHPISHRGMTLFGAVLNVELSSPLKDVIRVRITHHRGKEAKGPAFELTEAEPEIRFSESAESLVFTSGELTATIARSGDWNISFANSRGELTHTGVRNMGYMETDDGGAFVKEELHLSVDEKVYGLGERFTPYIKNGQTVDIWNEDGGTSSEQSYKNIPFYMTSRGYAVLVNHPERVSFEVGSEKVAKVQFSVPGEELEYLIIGGSDLKDVLKNYTALTGRPALPPSWSFGLWLTTSFTTDYDEETVTSFVDGMREREIPLHTFHFDCFWMKAYNWCDFTWDRDVFPDPPGMIRRLKAKGLHICLWINPYISQESPLFAEGKEQGFLIKKENGDVWQWDLWQPGMGIVDFTNPGACRWYESKLKVLMDMGVDTFKTDFGERIPTDVIYHDGSDPLKMHNYYTYLYNRVVFNLLEGELGKGKALVFARSATVGGQKFPVHWGGDCSSSFESMAESLRGGLSLCLSGFGFWSHDIGGFESTSTPDVYKRWAAFGLLSTHSRLHGSSSYRVPWAYDEESVEVVRFFSRLKCRLMPYLFSSAVDTSESGVPMMRPMVLEYPHDISCRFLDKQYFMGASLLVAPVFSEKGEVSYYLPEGKWLNFLTNEGVEGGRYVSEKHGYLTLPLMMKPDSVVPVGAVSDRPDYDYAEGVCYHINGFPRNQQVRISDSEGNPSNDILFHSEGDSLVIDVTTVKADFSLLLRNVTSVTCAEGSAEKNELGTLIRFAASVKRAALTVHA
ncbi:MAG: alpha-xylosidase [Spirochaetales bacterium]|nr:alpha-xylosidase [Spirochaetales bacterium]